LVAVLDHVGVHAGGVVEANEVIILCAGLELDDDGVLASVRRVVRDADYFFIE